MLKVGVSDASGAPKVVLTGALDEHGRDELEKLASKLPGATTCVTIDCGGIKTINSPGIESWSEFIHKLSAARPVELIHCPVAMIEYANLAEIVVADAEVVSLFVPLRCTACGKSSEVLTTVAALGPERELKTKKCGECGGAQAMEVEAEHYFAFLDFGPVDEN